MRVIASLLLALFMVSFGAAQAAESQSPQALVRSTSDQVLARLKADHDDLKAHPEKVYGLVEDLVLPHFDFHRIARWVLGKYSRRASRAQMEEFTKEFRMLLVRTYATALLQYTNQQIDYLPLRMRPGATDVTVKTEIQQPGAFPIPIDYDLYRPDGSSEWKVYDVSIDSVSLVGNYRTTFAGEIRDKGLDALIKSLARRNREAGQ